MKTTITFILACLILACNPGKEKENHKINDPAAEDHSQHAGKAGLELNNGSKWKADSVTVVNVALLQQTVSDAKKESQVDYNEVAAKLQEGLNKMVAECKMNGPDHDALHQWLEPLMEKVKELNKETAFKTAAEKLVDIEKQLGLFTQYFE